MNDTLRQRITARWRDEIEGKESFDHAALTEKLMAEFIEDREFCNRFFDEFLRPVVSRIGMDVFGQQKKVIREMRPQQDRSVIAAHTVAVRAASPIVPATPPERLMPTMRSDTALVKPPSNLMSRWHERMEVDPDTSERRTVFRMTKRTLLNLAARYRTSGVAMFKNAALFELMAGPLEHMDDVAGDYWSSRIPQLERLERDIEVERTRYRLRSLMQGAA